MIAPLLLTLITAQAQNVNDPKAMELLAAMPDAYAKYESLQMTVRLQASVDGQTGQVESTVLAMKPNLFVIDQMSKTPNGVERRQFFCDGEKIAFPEPRHPDRFIADDHPMPQWAGNMRNFGSLMLDNGWPFGVIFRSKVETQEFLAKLRNVKDTGAIALQDGTEGKLITCDLVEEVSSRPGSRIMAKERSIYNIEVVLDPDGLMRRVSFTSPKVMQTDERISPGQIAPAVEAATTTKLMAVKMVWTMEYNKAVKPAKTAFRLPPLRYEKPQEKP